MTLLLQTDTISGLSLQECTLCPHLSSVTNKVSFFSPNVLLLKVPDVSFTCSATTRGTTKIILSVEEVLQKISQMNS